MVHWATLVFRNPVAAGPRPLPCRCDADLPPAVRPAATGQQLGLLVSFWYTTQLAVINSNSFINDIPGWKFD